MPYQDGPFPSGAGLVTINSVDHKCNSFQIDQDDEVKDIMDENGAHSGALAFKRKITGSAELQVATANVVSMTTAAVSATTGVFTRDNVNYFITGVSQPKQADAAWVRNIKFQNRVN